MTKNHREPPFPDDVKLHEPGPGVGPLRRLVRAFCRRLLGFWLEPLSRSVEDRLFEAAVARRELFEELNDRLVKLEQAGLNSRVGRLERGSLGTTLTSSFPSACAEEKREEWRASACRVARQYRNDEKALQERAEWYLEQLGDLSPIVDLGCGQGIFLEAARAKGLTAEGCDLDSWTIEICQSKELKVCQHDCREFLRAKKEGSIGAIVASHVLEHLPLSQLDELLDLAFSRLVAGGKLLVELPHPGSFMGLVSFSKDLTHQRPIHPETMAILLEQKGFEEVSTSFLDPVEKASRLVPVAHSQDREEADQWARVARNFVLLDEAVFGFQSFSVMATVPKEEGSS